MTTTKKFWSPPHRLYDLGRHIEQPLSHLPPISLKFESKKSFVTTPWAWGHFNDSSRLLPLRLNFRAVQLEILRGGTDWKKSWMPPTHFVGNAPPHIFIFGLQSAPLEDLKWNSPYFAEDEFAAAHFDQIVTVPDTDSIP